MTGQKDRYTTTEKLWRLPDETLTTPQHDEMVIWLLNPDNVKSIIKNDFVVGGVMKPILMSNIDLFVYNRTYYSEIIHDGLLKYFGISREYPKNIKEYCTNGYKYNRSYDLLSAIYDIYHNTNMDLYDSTVVDIWDELRHELNMIRDHTLDNKQSIYDYLSIESEKPLVIKYNKFIVGYVDIYLHFEIPKYTTNHFKLEYNFTNIVNDCCIEVKSNIKSFGQTLRQLKTYKEHLPKNTIMCIFTTDMTFKKAFESQGIKVLTYPE